MPDITVNIRGNAEQLRRELNDVSNVGSPQGVVNKQDVFEQFSERKESKGKFNDRYYEDLARQRMNDAQAEITRGYDERRADLQGKTGGRYDEVDRRVEEARKIAEGSYSNPNDPLVKGMLDQQMEGMRERMYREVGEKVDREEESLNQQEKEEKQNVEKELIEAIRNLAEEYQNQSTEGSDSYISKLREEKRRLLTERDLASDEDEALDRQREIDSLNERLSPFDGRTGREQEVDPYGLKILGLTTSGGNAVRALGEGNIGGAIQGVSGGIASAVGGKAGMAIGGVGGTVGMIWELIEMFADADGKLREFTRSRAVSGGKLGTEGFDALKQTLEQGAFGMTNQDIGLSEQDFVKMAAESISKRGTSENWYQEAMGQVAMEKSLNLKEGSLQEGGQFDRYGKTVTDSVAGMVTMLTEMTKAGINTGVSETDFTRVQEKYDIQQGIMRNYMGMSDKPSYAAANTMLGAMSSVRGITQDSRIGGEIQSMQGMVRNPMNDRMRALVMDTASEILPEAGGRLDIIDRLMKKPENENKVIQAVIERITKQFGGMDSTIGYFAMKAALPNISPDRLMEISKGVSSGTAGNILKTGGGAGAYAGIGKEDYIKQATTLVTGVAEAKVAVVDAIKGLGTLFGGKSNDSK